ncbi:hypothetical protein V8C26DRAFT_105411 [Trichoderma gracile]
MAPQRPKPPMESIFLSEPFKFVVGPNKKRYSLHKGAVARLSKSLYQLLNGRMREAKEHCVSWEDTDENTFIRFGEWAYTGDYTPGSPEILLDASQIATSEQEGTVAKKQSPVDESLLTLLKLSRAKFETPKRHCDVDWTASEYNYNCNVCSSKFASQCCTKCHIPRHANCTACRNDAMRRSTKYRMMEAFVSDHPQEQDNATRSPRKIPESCEDYTDVFLSHAQLYVIADKYDIPELGQYCLSNLYADLLNRNVHENRTGDILSLARYSFNNTVETDKLRHLVVGYCACFMKQITTSDGFKALIDECPDFGHQLMVEVGKYMD